eukprot:1160269-Pelagomonas_calceolata.AAC.4
MVLKLNCYPTFHGCMNPGKSYPRTQERREFPVKCCRKREKNHTKYGCEIEAGREKGKTTQAAKTLPTLIQEKRIPRAEAPCIPFTERNKRN